MSESSGDRCVATEQLRPTGPGGFQLIRLKHGQGFLLGVKGDIITSTLQLDYAVAKRDITASLHSRLLSGSLAGPGPTSSHCEARVGFSYRKCKQGYAAIDGGDLGATSSAREWVRQMQGLLDEDGFPVVADAFAPAPIRALPQNPIAAQPFLKGGQCPYCISLEHWHDWAGEFLSSHALYPAHALCANMWVVFLQRLLAAVCTVSHSSMLTCVALRCRHSRAAVCIDMLGDVAAWRVAHIHRMWKGRLPSRHACWVLWSRHRPRRRSSSSRAKPTPGAVNLVACVGALQLPQLHQGPRAAANRAQGRPPTSSLG